MPEQAAYVNANVHGVWRRERFGHAPCPESYCKSECLPVHRRNRCSGIPLPFPCRSTMTTLDSDQSLFSAESYFGTQLPPPTLDHDIADVRSFVHRQRDLNRKVVLVTVSVAPTLLLSAQCPCQERWDDCPVRTQRVSVCRTQCLELTPL